MTNAFRVDEVPARQPEVAPGRAPNFDRLAGVYRWLEAFSFGPWLWRCRCAFLSEMKGARRALVLGDGDGRFTARLLRENPSVLVNAVDISRAMLDSLRREAGDNAGRVRTQVADVRRWSPAGGGAGEDYDLVVTHFFLDCLTTDEVGALAARVRPALADNATWVVSEFAVPAGWFGRWVAGPVVGLLYWAFGWMTGLRTREMPDYARALKEVGFRLVQRRHWLGGLLVSECWSSKQSAS